MTILLPQAGLGLIVLGAGWFGDGACVITPQPCAVYYYYQFTKL